MQKKKLAVFCSFRMVGPDTRTHTSFEPRKIKKKIDRQEQQLLILLQQTFHLWQSTSSGYSLYLFSYKNLRRKHSFIHSIQFNSEENVKNLELNCEEKKKEMR